MKRLFSIGAFLLALLLAVGCSKYDDSGLTDRINDLEQRMKELETLCKETNTNISSLQTLVSAVQNGDYVKEVTPIMQDGKEVGCTISFGKGDPITIYHDKESNTGSGTMPVIGVRQDESGTFYWTLNGEWLLDDTGNKIKAQGSDGKDGEVGRPGQDGTDGKDGITPQLKIENDFWFVSTDNGNTWTNLGKATTGSNSSDPMFQEVKQDDHNVYFTLASGEKITIPKTSGLSISFQEGNTLLFNNVNETQTIHYTITGGSGNNVVKAEMLNTDGSYTVRTTSTSATAGTIEIQTTIPTKNRVIVSVSDGNHTIMAAIDVSLAPSFDGQTVKVETPGTLSTLLVGYDQSTITELTVIGSINSTDVATLKALPNLSVLDMENTNLTELPSNAFKDNKTLTSVKLPQGLTTIGSIAFLGCSGLTSVTIPNSVTTIGNGAFWSSGLTGNLTIPNSVTTIGSNAFRGCKGLTGDLTIPNSVTEIGSSAFSGCSGFTGNLTIPNSVTEIGSSAFSGCSGFTGNLTIPNSVTEIGSSAFSGCSGLTGNLTIPNSVTTIGEQAFVDCSGLMGTLTIPNGVKTIEDGAFFGCYSLTSVTIPQSVTLIKSDAFLRCKLTQINCQSNTPPQLKYSAFHSTLMIYCALYVPTGCAEAYRTAEGWKDITFKDIIETEF